jgi:pimeloyl-ACP methyl ester carboxylesterase
MTGPAMARRTATRPAPWAFAAPWGARGYVTDLDGPVHWVEFGESPGSGPDRDEPPIVFVHGLGGSHLNWSLIGPQLAADRRAVALDLHGFGLTPGGRYMSTVQRVVDLCFADPSRADPAMLTASIALAAERQSQPVRARDQAFLAASRSLMRVVGLRRRYWEMMASVRVPVLLIGGEADRLVPVASMRQAAARNPSWETVILPGVGHTPQLEVPDVVAEALRDWLGRNSSPAAG